MFNRPFEITDAKGGAALGVRVVTRATASEVVGMQEDGTLKVRLKAGPAGSVEANNELISLLANQFQVADKNIEIIAGEGNRDKLLSIVGITADDLEELLGSK